MMLCRWVAYDDATRQMQLLGRKDTLPVWVEGERAVWHSRLCCIVQFCCVQHRAQVRPPSSRLCTRPAPLHSNQLEVSPTCAAGRSTIVTMAAVQRAAGVSVAPVGLTNMMNVGGAVKDFQLSGDSSRNGDSSDASASVQVHSPAACHINRCC